MNHGSVDSGEACCFCWGCEGGTYFVCAFFQDSRLALCVLAVVVVCVVMLADVRGWAPYLSRYAVCGVGG
jgi:hypothetical protein